MKHGDTVAENDKTMTIGDAYALQLARETIAQARLYLAWRDIPPVPLWKAAFVRSPYMPYPPDPQEVYAAEKTIKRLGSAQT